MDRAAKFGLMLSVGLGVFLAMIYYLLLPSPWSLLGGPPPTPHEVIEGFKKEGLEVGTYYDVEEENEGMGIPVPQTYIQGTRFTIPSLKAPNPLGPDGRPVSDAEVEEVFGPPEDAGGRVFTFKSQEDLQAVRNYYEGLGRVTGWLDSHIYVQGNVLLQINGDLPDARAEEYGKALKKLVAY